MSSQDNALIEKLKQQRDRFIAFAFAGADLLIELDEEGVVAFSAGAGEALYGISDEDLTGSPLASFILTRDLKKFEEALLRLRNTGRLDHTAITVLGRNGAVSRMRMGGIKLPQFPRGCHLVMSRLSPIAEEMDPASQGDPKLRFVDMVRNRLNEANRLGESYTLTLVDLSGSNFASSDPAAVQSFLSTVQHALDSFSVRQNSAGPLGDAAFGLLHGADITAQAVAMQVADVARQFGDKVKGSSLKMRSASVDMKDAALSEDDIEKALGYIVNGFVKDSANFVITSLAEAAKVAVADTLSRIRNFRKMIKGDNLVFVYQPMINVETGGVLAFEAFGRIAHEKGFFNPAQIIPFATDVGVIGEFDLVAVKRALTVMRAAQEVSSTASLAVNISGTSLGNPAFYHALLKLLEAAKPQLPRLVLEITDASRIYNLDEARRLLARIKRMGVRLSLDDFGTGGSAFEILKMLPVDFVKLDAALVREARGKRGRSVLKALTSLTHDLGMTAIAECVEDTAMLDLVREVGIGYAQGYLFAQPAADAAKRVRYYKDHLAKTEAGAA